MVPRQRLTMMQPLYYCAAMEATELAWAWQGHGHGRRQHAKASDETPHILAHVVRCSLCTVHFALYTWIRLAASSLMSSGALGR